METNPEAIVKWYDDKVKDEFADLFSRMDEDYEIWDMNPTPSNLTAYEVAVKARTKEHGSQLDVVSNELRTNCDNVQSILSSSDMQIMVRLAEAEGIDLRSEMGKLERLFYFLLEQGDLRLRQLLLPSLRESSDWHALVRGWRASRILTYKGQKGKVITKYSALDPRWLVYDIGSEGLLKAGYKTFKAGVALKSEWGQDAKKKRDNEVIDYWEFDAPYKIWNAVVCKDVFLKDPEILKMRSMPFVIIPVSTRPPIAGAEGIKLKGFGDSLFASARNIHALRNRFASILANLASLKANLPTVHYRARDGGRDLPPFYTFNVPGDVIELTMGEDELASPPVGDISSTETYLLSWLTNQVRGTLLPSFELEEPPASGTRYALAAEASNKIFNPQLRSLNHSYEGICRLIEEQLIDGGIRVKFQSLLKNKYDEVEVTPVDLKKPHIIKVEFTARTPWEQMDTAQVAQMLKALGLPDGWIWENILKVQDPRRLELLAALELYKHSPEGAMSEAAEALITILGDRERADLLIEELDRLEAQKRAMTGGGITLPGETTSTKETMPPE